MEKNGLEVLIYVLIIVASIMGPIIKKSRETKRQSGRPTGGLPPEPEVEWTRWIEADEDEEQPVYHIDVPEVKPKPAVSEKHYTDDGKSRKQNPELQRIINSEGGRMNRAATKAPQVPSEQDVNHDAGIEFDLRTAVIYSEILKPKYDEY